MENNFNDAAIDSLKVRIPLYKAKISNELRNKWILVNEETGEYDPDYFKTNSLKYDDDGIKVKAALEKQQTVNKTSEEYLIILISSKILGSRYFEGITKENIKIVYDYLIMLDFASFSFDTFLNHSACTDIDWKKDIIFNEPEKLFKTVCSMSKFNNKKGYGYRSFNDKKNQGIEFSDRKTQAFKTNPYFKIYNKEKELIYKSVQFYEKYIKGKGFKLKNRIRLEATVKNKKHLRLLGVMDNSLNTLLNLSEKRKYDIFKTAVNAHLNPLVPPLKKHRGDMNPNDIVIYNMMQLLVLKGLPEETILNSSLNGIDLPSTRSRKKKALKNIYSNYLKGTDQDKENKEVGDVLIMMGLEREV